MAGVNKVFSLADDVARYLKACGKTSVLQTKPVNPSQIKGLKLATKLESDVVEFSTKEIKLDDELFDFLPWRKGYKKLPSTGKPPAYTPEAKKASESFAERGWIEEPLPNGFRMPYGPYKNTFDANGIPKPGPKRSPGHEFLYFNEDSNGIRIMIERLKKVFSANPNISEKEKAKILHKFVDSCYDRSRTSWVAGFSDDLIPIENTAATGAGVCRHKSLLAKVLGDKLGLKIAMARGHFTVDKEIGLTESHIWNELKIGNKWYLMDIEQGRFEALDEFLDFSKLYTYAH